MGSLLAPYISDIYGRKMVICIGGFFATLGAALQGGAVTIAMLIAGRFIAGFAIGLMSATIPVYCVCGPRLVWNRFSNQWLIGNQSEAAPPRIRGLLASMQQWMVGLGAIVAVSRRNHSNVSSHLLTSLSSNGSDTDVPYTMGTSPGDFLCPYQQHRP